jgi:signal transduction histidine kinase
MAEASILIVEDESIVALDLQNQLRLMGHTVSGVADSGREAVRMAEGTQPDLVLMDIQLQGVMDGVEAARELRARLDIPVVFLTACADEGMLERVKATQAFGYLLKPFEERALQVTIEIALYKHATEQQLREYAAALEARNRELDAFSHTVAHDLKAPLGTILSFADLLQSEQARLADEDLRLCARGIARSGRKMLNVIDELLILAEVRQGQVDAQPLDMTTIVDAAQKRLAAMIERRQVEIVLPETWPVALGYGPWVEEVWVNYLSNAIKYGGEPPRVELGTDVMHQEGLSGGRVRFWVCDNGAGLAQEDQGRLFVPFTRLDQARAEGHGLGLSIVRRIVEKLGGEVGVHSEPGEGSRFYFALPLANGSKRP